MSILLLHSAFKITSGARSENDCGGSNVRRELQLAAILREHTIRKGTKDKAKCGFLPWLKSMTL